ncbi:MAG: ABC transporter permease [Selenomonadaceae bacterium]|nr:ABC transporter permease [Selenomonadaceae bacterium]
MNYVKKIYLATIFLFLYAPIGVLIAQSFNASRYRGHWTGVTLDWYTKLFNDDKIVNALTNTLTIGILSAGIATILGLITCVAMKELSRKWRATFLSVTNVPILNADIVTGISLMLLFMGLGLRLGYASILLAHIVFNVPYVILCIMPQLMALDKSFYEAALDLGASPFKAFKDVVLPELRPSIFAGFLLAFTMSADDFIITHFTKGAGVDTLTTAIYAELKIGIHPEMYALSTLVFFFVLIFVMLFAINRRKLKRADDVF